jgi:ubiquinone/menaquinone biosynthesis C-methylase UbiE
MIPNKTVNVVRNGSRVTVLFFVRRSMRLHSSMSNVHDGTKPSTESDLRTKGRVVHWAARYDLLAWFFLVGRERAFRERLLDLARLERGAKVLDIGCGTGTLAIAASRRVGAGGSVHGVDASPAMIERAQAKARKAGAAIDFREAVVEALPFTDRRFDVVLSTLMLHHLPRAAREQCLREVRRVLTRGGRALFVDFGLPGKHKTLLDHFHRHGHIKLEELLEMVRDAGLGAVQSGPVGTKNLQFILATPA